MVTCGGGPRVTARADRSSAGRLRSPLLSRRFRSPGPRGSKAPCGCAAAEDELIFEYPALDMIGEEIGEPDLLTAETTMLELLAA